MKKRPILFNAAMVRAILTGTKTQTRRIVKYQPENAVSVREFTNPQRFAFRDKAGVPADGEIYDCPYGQPGDRLWCKETFAIEDPSEYWFEDPRKDSQPDRPWKWLDDGWGKRPLIPHYRADGVDPNIVTEEQCDAGDDRTRWRPSIHMPRWASRITLEIVGVRVERLNDISEEDAKAEGIRSTHLQFAGPEGVTMWHAGDKWPADTCGDSPQLAFGALWESINGPGSWAANPWVWAVEFKRVTP